MRVACFLLAWGVAVASGIIVDNTDSQIVYSGEWEIFPSPLNFGGNHGLSVSGGTATLRFRGSSVSLLSPLWPYVVTSAVSLDGGPIVNLDLRDYSQPFDEAGGEETAQYSAVFTRTDLDVTVEHTLVVSTAPGGQFTVLDAIEYTPVDASVSSSSSSSSFTSSSTSSHVSTTSSPSSTQTNSPSALTDPTPSKSNSLAIGLGAGLGGLALLIALLLALCLCRRRKRKQVVEDPLDPWGKSEPMYPPVNLLAEDSVSSHRALSPTAGGHSRPFTTTSYNTDTTAGFAGLGASTLYSPSGGNKDIPPVPQIHHPYTYSTYSAGDDSAYARSGMVPPVVAPPPMPRYQTPSAIAQYSSNEKQRIAYAHAQRDTAGASPYLPAGTSASRQLPPGAQAPYNEKQALAYAQAQGANRGETEGDGPPIYHQR